MSSEAEPFPRRHRLTTAEYHRIGESGALAPDARVELIDGEIVDMAPIGPRHGGLVEQVAAILRDAVGASAMVRTQNPVVLNDCSEVQPDVALVHTRADFYKPAHPRPDDVLLVVEVADTTLRFDREIKGPLYAGAGIPELWIVEVDGRAVRRFRAPRDGVYTVVEDAVPGTAFALIVLPDVAVDLGPLFE